MLDELILGGEIQETSKKNVLKSIQAQDLLQEVSEKNNVSGEVVNTFILWRDCGYTYLKHL
jgi:hypothetical protein